MLRITCSQYDLIEVLKILTDYDDILYTVHNACSDKNAAFIYINDYDNEDVTDFYANMELCILAMNQLVLDRLTEHIYVKIGDMTFVLDGQEDVRDSAVNEIRKYEKL